MIGKRSAIGIFLSLALSACVTVNGGDNALTGETNWGVSKPGDELGNAKALGPETWARCAAEISAPGAKSYELSYVRSNTMPASPFGGPLKYSYRGTLGLPGTRHAFNGETVSGEEAAQATQMDALGHFGFLDEPWDGKGAFPTDKVRYFGGFTQKDVKPNAVAPLAHLGVEKVPPIITTAILLDAQSYIGKGAPLGPGDLVTANDIEAMLIAQGLGVRGLLPGDVLYIRTGWGEKWTDPASDPDYYAMGPGLSFDAVQLIGAKGIALVSLDNPFTDPVNRGQLQGQAGPAAGTPEGLPFVNHHYNLTQSGVLQIQNSRLDELANDKVWLSCTMILPLRIEGGSGSPVRSVAIGAPR